MKQSLMLFLSLLITKDGKSSYVALGTRKNIVRARAFLPGSFPLTTMFYSSER